MTSVICKAVEVMVVCLTGSSGPIYCSSYMNLTGFVKAEDSKGYVVDFSKDASEQGAFGDYSNIPVKKSSCVKIGK